MARGKGSSLFKFYHSRLLGSDSDPRLSLFNSPAFRFHRRLDRSSGRSRVLR